MQYTEVCKSILEYTNMCKSILNHKVKIFNFVVLQYNLSILDTLGLNNTVLIMEVSLFQRFINTHLYCIGTDTTCPDYRGVLILECPQ